MEKLKAVKKVELVHKEVRGELCSPLEKAVPDSPISANELGTPSPIKEM